jgi:hypothetical protein
MPDEVVGHWVLATRLEYFDEEFLKQHAALENTFGGDEFGEDDFQLDIKNIGKTDLANNETRFRILENLNRAEIPRLDDDELYWGKLQKQFPKDIVVKQYLEFLSFVRECFVEWYEENDDFLFNAQGGLLSDEPIEYWREDYQIYKKSIENIQPSIEIARTSEAPRQKVKSKKRLILSPNEREILNNKIVSEVEDYTYSGKGSWEEAFNALSADSEKLFGYKLDKGAIEGRFKRTKGKRK